MKLKVPVSTKYCKPEVKTTDDNTELIKKLTRDIENLDDQINQSQQLRRIARKEKFLLENVPYNEGDKVVFNTSSNRDKIDLVTGILEYEDDGVFSPYFFVRPYKKGTEELANMRRRVYNKEQIVKFA
jgi:hypothetical protein